MSTGGCQFTALLEGCFVGLCQPYTNLLYYYEECDLNFLELVLEWCVYAFTNCKVEIYS